MQSSMGRRFAILASTMLLVPAIGIAAVVGVASAASLPAADATAGWARFAHFAPGTQAVDVLVDGAAWATNISFKDVTQYLPLPVGVHHFSIAPADSPASAPVLEIDAGVPAGGAITVSAVTTQDGLAPQVFDDSLTTPPAGQSLVRFIHAAPDVPAVDVQVVGGPVLASDVTYPWATSYQPIAAGSYDVDVKPVGSDQVLLHISSWSIEPGAQSSIVIVKGTDGALDVVPVLDSSAVAVAPTGGIQTDEGPIASPARRSTAMILSFAALVLLLAGSATACSVRFVKTRRIITSGR